MSTDERPRDSWTPVDGHPGVAVRFRTDAATGRVAVCGVRIERDIVGTNDLRGIPLAHIETMANLGDGAAADLPALARPDGTDPHGFYRLLAEHYRSAVATTPKPAVRLAHAAGVPVPTVHRWIAEARRRGFLPPARKGRAG